MEDSPNEVQNINRPTPIEEVEEPKTIEELQKEVDERWNRLLELEEITNK